MILKKWLLFNEVRTEDFCKKVGISRTAILHYLRRDREPRASTCKKIIAATNGEVTLDDLCAVVKQAGK